MSVFVYNGVTLGYCRTKRYSFGSESDPSKTDVLWNTYEMVVEGVPLDGAGSIITPTAAVIADIQHVLNAPRRPLLYQMNDGVTTVLTTGIDAAMGPEIISPAAVDVVTSGGIFVTVHYKVRIRDCATGRPDPVVSLRWRQSESFGETWNSKLVTDGRLIVRTDLLSSADSFRDLTTPQVLPDYVRTASNYTLNENGTELAFHFEDEERDRLPPYPAVKASGSFVVHVTKGANRTAQVDVTLTGQKGTDRKDLMVVAIRMCLSKVKAAGLSFHNAGSFHEDLFEPVVKVSMQARLNPLTGGGIGSAILAAAGAGGVRPPAVFPTVGVLPDGVKEGRPGIAPPIRKRITGLLVAAFRDPCAAEASADEVELRSGPSGYTPGLKNKKGGGELRAGFTLGVGPLPPFPGDSAVKDFAPYDHYHVESTWTFDGGISHLPGTGVGPDGAVAGFYTLHGGQMQLMVAWAAVRSGLPPVLPSYLTPDANLQPLTGAVTIDNSDVEADATSPVYAVGGWYLYGVKDPRLVSLNAAVPPFLSDSAAQAGPQAGRYYSDSILWRFVGAVGNNPFVAGGTQTGEPPAQVATQLGGGDLGGGGDFGGSDPPPPGGLDSGSGGGNGLLGGPPSNP